MTDKDSMIGRPVAVPTVYVQTKEQCENKIRGVCEGCGGPLSAIETVDNSRRPTFWVGCEFCLRFRIGVEMRHYKIAHELFLDHTLPINRMEQLSLFISRIDKLLNADLERQLAEVTAHRDRLMKLVDEEG